MVKEKQTPHQQCTRAWDYHTSQESFSSRLDPLNEVSLGRRDVTLLVNVSSSHTGFPLMSRLVKAIETNTVMSTSSMSVNKSERYTVKRIPYYEICTLCLCQDSK